MSAVSSSSNETPPAPRWRLWVDGCGGYLLLGGDRWSVGGIDEQSPADISVRTDWPRRAGTIDRVGADYFWQDPQDQSRQLIRHRQPLPIGGSAAMTLNCPSPLCSSAVLSVAAPHRFAGHVDSVILVDQILLIGGDHDCHVDAREFPDRAVLVNRAGKWLGKLDSGSEFHRNHPWNPRYASIPGDDFGRSMSKAKQADRTLSAAENEPDTGKKPAAVESAPDDHSPGALVKCRGIWSRSTCNHSRPKHRFMAALLDKIRSPQQPERPDASLRRRRWRFLCRPQLRPILITDSSPTPSRAIHLLR